MAKGQSISERFWSKVDKRGPDECWLWMAGILVTAGLPTYGMMWVGKQNQAAHRVSWQIHFGPIPDGLFVLHRCDNMPCVNPAHLWLGTQLDNMRDRSAKGRAPIGEKAGLARLTEEQVRAIRLDMRSNSALGRTYGVHRKTIEYIRIRRTWKHLA